MLLQLKLRNASNAQTCGATCVKTHPNSTNGSVLRFVFNVRSRELDAFVWFHQVFGESVGLQIQPWSRREWHNKRNNKTSCKCLLVTLWIATCVYKYIFFKTLIVFYFKHLQYNVVYIMYSDHGNTFRKRKKYILQYHSITIVHAHFQQASTSGLLQDVLSYNS